METREVLVDTVKHFRKAMVTFEYLAKSLEQHIDNIDSKLNGDCTKSVEGSIITAEKPDIALLEPEIYHIISGMKTASASFLLDTAWKIYDSLGVNSPELSTPIGHAEARLVSTSGERLR